MMDQQALGKIAGEFQLAGELAGATPIGSGHIHDSYRLLFVNAGKPAEYVLQRINTRVFTRPAELMQNFERVTQHLAAGIQGRADADRRVLRLMPSRSGASHSIDASGAWWRMFPFIPGARGFDSVTPEQAWQVAYAVGDFQRRLADLPGPPLHDTIPNFHNTPMRFAALEQAIAADVAGRAKSVQAEIEFARHREPVTHSLIQAAMPERNVHNDAKSNNVLLDEHTGKALCVIDLDTVMRGLAVHDFGDMMRSISSPAAEDEPDLARVFMRFEFYTSLLQGYLAAAGEMLTRDEKQMLAIAGKVITFENGLRFLSDYLAGDTYYKTEYPEQNLNRCRAHFKLVESMESQEDQMIRAVHDLL